MLAVASNQYLMREGVGHDIGKCIIMVKMRTCKIARPNNIVLVIISSSNFTK